MDEYGNTITALKLLRDNVRSLMGACLKVANYDGHDALYKVLEIINEMIGEEPEEGEDDS